MKLKNIVSCVGLVGCAAIIATGIAFTSKYASERNQYLKDKKTETGYVLPSKYYPLSLNR